MLDEARRRLGSQDSSIASARSAAGTVLSAAAIGSSFLASEALADHVGVPWLGWIGLASLTMSILCCLRVLLGAVLRISTVAAVYAEESWQALDDDQATAELARILSNRATENDLKIKPLWRWLSAGILATGVSLVAWLLLIGLR